MTVTGKKNLNWTNMLKEEFKNIKESPRDLRKFGITIGTVLIILSALLFYFEKPSYLYIAIASAILFVCAFFLPIALKPFNRAWMSLAIVLGLISSHIILFILFYLIVTPIGILVRTFKKDFFLLKNDLTKNSYWIFREKKEFTSSDYEKQF